MHQINRVAIRATPFTAVHHLSVLVPRLPSRLSSLSSVWPSSVGLLTYSFYAAAGTEDRRTPHKMSNSKSQLVPDTSRTIFPSHLHHELHELDVTYQYPRYRTTGHDRKRTVSVHCHCYILYLSPTFRIYRIWSAGRSSLSGT